MRKLEELHRQIDQRDHAFRENLKVIVLSKDSEASKEERLRLLTSWYKSEVRGLVIDAIITHETPH